MSDEGVRLQKVLAAAGLGSRRHCEELIADGLVEVNGRTVIEQGVRVDPTHDVIRVDGARIPPPRRHAYLMFHKPRGVVSTMDDPQGRSTIAEFLGKRVNEGLFHVGRLDTATEGLLIYQRRGLRPADGAPVALDQQDLRRRGGGRGRQRHAAQLGRESPWRTAPSGPTRSS